MATTCADSAYWREVRCLLAEPTWLVEQGLPLAFTLAGLGLAVWVLRRQLRHDRELRRADRLSGPVAAFGEVLVSTVEDVPKHEPPDEFWGRYAWPGYFKIARAQIKVRVALADPRAFWEIMRGAHDVLDVWMACNGRHRSMTATGDTFDEDLKAGAMLFTMRPLLDDLRTAGEDLSRWDGLSPIPTFSPWPRMHSPKSVYPRPEAVNRWKGFYVDTFERKLRKMQAARATHQPWMRQLDE